MMTARSAIAGNRRPVRRGARISLTPLVDVVFILVIFFMLASSFSRTNTVEVVPPAAPSGSAGAQVDHATLTILGQGAYDLDGELLNDAAIGPRLRALHGERLIVSTDGAARLQDVVAFLDLAHSVGLSGFALATERVRDEESDR